MQGGVDLQPIVLAVAGLIVALTPIAVAYLTAQVALIKGAVAMQGEQLTAGQEALKAQLAEVRARVGTAAVETQAVVKEQGGKAS